MAHGDPGRVVWWLVSRASGIIALVLITLSVAMGLAMAARVVRRPKVKRSVVRLHEHVALISLAAIAAHGLALLGDHWLHPGPRGIAVPFALSYRPVFTGLGIIGGYLALLLGPSFYLRRRIGARRWRSAHRATVIVWVLAAVHAVGSGSDGKAIWLRAIVAVPAVPLAYLLVLRLLPASTRLAGDPTRRAEATRSVPPPRHQTHRAPSGAGRHSRLSANPRLSIETSSPENLCRPSARPLGS